MRMSVVIALSLGTKQNRTNAKAQIISFGDEAVTAVSHLPSLTPLYN